MGTENKLRERLNAFPRVSLTVLPTPLMRARNLEKALGADSPQIWIKRDDMTGLAFGGNKSRKLEYLVGDARAQGATVLISEGAAQSNHARQTAAAAAMAGMKCVLVLDTRRGQELTGNLLLDRLLGADVRLVPTGTDRKPEMLRLADELAVAGQTPYLVPTGGSVPMGALGYVNFVLELQLQLNEVGLHPNRLYFPTGSQGTQAGIIAGALAMECSFEVRGVAVEATTAELASDCVPLTNETLALLDQSCQVKQVDISIDDTQVGDGYAIPTESGMEAIGLLARTEAVVLDPVYTGKALAALIADVRNGQFDKNESVVFLHTGGGPSVFANLEAFGTLLDKKEHLF